MTSLFDVSVLLALLDAAHVHHRTAKSWLLSQENPTWASCPLTQNGFVRIISQPSYPGRISFEEATNLLGDACAHGSHQFWPDDISILDKTYFDHALNHGPKQVTDAYLLALAVKRGGRLVALDRTISIGCVREATGQSLIVL